MLAASVLFSEEKERKGSTLCSPDFRIPRKEVVKFSCYSGGPLSLFSYCAIPNQF